MPQKGAVKLARAPCRTCRGVFLVFPPTTPKRVPSKKKFISTRCGQDQEPKCFLEGTLGGVALRIIPEEAYHFWRSSIFRHNQALDLHDLRVNTIVHTKLYCMVSFVGGLSLRDTIWGAK